MVCLRQTSRILLFLIYFCVSNGFSDLFAFESLCNSDFTPTNFGDILFHCRFNITCTELLQLFESLYLTKSVLK